MQRPRLGDRELGWPGQEHPPAALKLGLARARPCREEVRVYTNWYQAFLVAQVEKAFQLAVRLTPVEYRQIEALVSSGLYRSGADFVREAVRARLRSFEVQSVKRVSGKEAERMIVRYLETHSGSHFASDLADQLGLEYALAFRTVNHLLESGKIRRSKVPG